MHDLNLGQVKQIINGKCPVSAVLLLLEVAIF